jgi:hydrogenase expression/formation protein HypE
MNGRSEEFGCPVSSAGAGDLITLAHGEGGRLTRQLIQQRILPRLRHVGGIGDLPDAARLPRPGGELAFSTDSFVVSPLFFPGGDIGKLAVYGTANDLAVAGARPLWLSLSLILEEGLPLALLDRVLESTANAADSIGLKIVAGDTKVVPRGAADGLFITTAGVGELINPVPPGPTALQPTDELIVSGPIARHGIAVLAARDQLSVEPLPESDCGPLWPAVESLRRAGIAPRAMRDATRGGVAAVLHEWAGSSGMTLVIDEDRLPVAADIRGVCELLGLDPLHVANEGTMVLAVSREQVATALDALRAVQQTVGAKAVGTVKARTLFPVTVRRLLGREQPLDEPLGAPLPRIC